MALKIFAGPRTTLLIISLLIILFSSFYCLAYTEKTEAVPLDRFYSGVFPKAYRRYRVKDIRIVDASVRHLFKEIPRTKPALRPGGYLWPEEIPLVINGGKEMDELRQVLIAHEGKPLEVVLEDAWNPWNSEPPYQYTIAIPVTFETTPCEKATRLIYQKTIATSIKKENEQSVIKQGQTNRRLDMNEVFDKLANDHEIETYMKELDPVKDSPCVETFRLFKSQTKDKTTGFVSGEYTLYPRIQAGLKLIVKAMAIAPDWLKSDLSVKVTGFTDEVEVRKNTDKKLAISQTGISADRWNAIDNRFEVYYDGCQGNKLNEKDRFVFLSFITNGSVHQVGSPIRNNCELGAVRAYVAMVYITSELGRISPDDSYATGGIFSGKDASTKKDDPEKRRVHVEFTIRAAKVER